MYQTEQNVSFLNGERANLRRLCKHDVGLAYLQWLNDPRVTKYLTVGKLPPSLGDLYHYVSTFEQNPKATAFAVIARDGGRFIGTVTLNNIDWFSRHADLGMMIGDAEAREEGYEKDALELIAEFAFNRLHLRRLYHGVFESQKERTEALEVLGWKREGAWEKHTLIGEEYEDEIWYGLVKDQPIPPSP